MRVTDRSIAQTYLITLQKSKQRLQYLQEKVTTQSEVNRPSDNPLANAKIMRLNDQIDTLETYKGNIDTALAEMGNTVTAMTGVQAESEKIIGYLTSVENATASDTLDVFATQIDNSLNAILDFANYKYNDNYLFAGTDFKTKPFGYNAGQSAIELKIPNAGGERNVNITDTSLQKVNISGEEMFMATFKQLGNLNTVSDPQTFSTTIYNADGNAFTLDLTYTRDGANNYDLTYDVPTTGISGTIQDLTFDAADGTLQSINGATPNSIQFTDAANKLDFVLDVTKLNESTSATQLTMEKNQETDIFNLLISIRDNLKNGITPNAQQVQMVNEFNSHVIGKLASAGNIQSRLEDTSELLAAQDLELQELLSKEKDVDLAKRIIELETEQYNLDTIYKISSMILPKSLLDYL